MEQSFMNKSLVVVAVALALSACASRPPKVDTVREEELSTDFVAEGIKVTSSGCGTMSKMFGRTCKIVRIDSVATAPTNGGTNNNRESGMIVACDKALANVSHWMGQRVESDRTTRRVGIANEVSQSKESQSNKGEEGSGESSVRENANDIKTEVTTVVRVNSKRYLTGWFTVNQDVVGKQEVKCTKRWDATNTELMNTFTSIR
jgi:cytochrome c5